MLQKLVELKRTVECSSIHAALTGVLEGLFIAGVPFVEVVSKPSHEGGIDEDFQRTHRILVQSHFIDADTPVNQDAAGRHHVRVKNPADVQSQIPFRIRLTDESEAAAVVLHLFLLLRVRFQTTGSGNPVAKVECSIESDVALDLLYLVGDAFTERYPVTASLERTDDRLRLILEGGLPSVSGGLLWARGDYVRCRDSSVLIRVLRLALDGSKDPLVIPREVRSGSLGRAFVRLPQSVRAGTIGLRWMKSLHELATKPNEFVAGVRGPLGEDLVIESEDGGYVAARDEKGTTEVVAVRALGPRADATAIIPEDDDSLAIAFEAMGGAREIGANCYVYSFGHRAVILDVGFDATRDGWLGLPALERLTRADVLILTHAHLDHVGSLPSLLAAFPNLVVYCTLATRAVLLPQLNDSAKVGGLRFRETGEMPALSRGLVDNIRFERFRTVAYGVATDVPEVPGLSIEFQDAGHIIGSACVRMTFAGTTILHTGDISVEDQHLLKGMEVEDNKVDHVVMEGTYCGDRNFTREQRRGATDTFLESIGRQLDQGGSILVPAFSLGRAQELVGMLVDWRARVGREVPIFTVGLVNVLNDVSAAHREFLPKLVGKPFAQVERFPDLKGDDDRRTAYANAFFQIASRTPSIIIASHGMMAENTGSFLIGRAILTGQDKRHAIFLCGYMDPRTPGFRLKNHCEAPQIEFGLGDLIERNIPATNIQFHRLTAHASYEELCEVAVRVATKSVTFIHGDGAGLDELSADVRGRIETSGKGTTVNVPAIGERILIGRVPRPTEWDRIDKDPPSSLGGVRRHHKQSGLSVGGLAEDARTRRDRHARDFRWGLIPVGATVAKLSLDLDRLSVQSIQRVTIRGQGSSATVFDAARSVGTLVDIGWGDVGPTQWVVNAVDPDGRHSQPIFNVIYGAELRPLRRTLDASDPILEIEVGGSAKPSAVSVVDEATGESLRLLGERWEASSRVLRLRLEPFGVGKIANLLLTIRWPNGFEQSGPALGQFASVARVTIGSSHGATAGVPTTISLTADPAPNAARLGPAEASLSADSLSVTPTTPGDYALELQYRTRRGETTWLEVGTIEVGPAAFVSLPAVGIVGQPVNIVVSAIDARLYSRNVKLIVADKVVSQWVADASEHTWSGAFEADDLLTVKLVLDDTHATLWTGELQISLHLELDWRASRLVASADGKHVARVAWRSVTQADRDAIDSAFRASGFDIDHWDQSVVMVRGSSKTLGSRTVTVEAEGRTTVRVFTVPDLELRLTNSAPSMGDTATIALAAGEVTAGLKEADGGPLWVDVDRVAPLFDSLSAKVRGNRIEFLHPGTYSIALCSERHRLAETCINVRARPEPAILPATTGHQLSGDLGQTVRALTSLAPLHATVAISPGEGYRVLQGPSVDIEQELVKFMLRQRDDGTRVAVSWPGLALPPLGGNALARLRAERPNDIVAHIPFPAPRGELVDDVESARRAREHRVLCSARRNSTIDRGDAYRCSACGGGMDVRSDTSRLWLSCRACSATDRAIVLTLSTLRSTDVTVLFTDYRMGTYLHRGSGSRYAGAFARSVRCSSCHSLQIGFPRPQPWNRIELHGLVAALASTWNPAAIDRSVGKAARMVANRDFDGAKDVRRLEELAQRLVDSGAIADGKPTAVVAALESGASTCCDAGLNWSRRRLARIYLGLEELMSPIPRSLHPDLNFGDTGLRQFLSLFS